MKRRLLSFVLAFAMLLSVTPVAVFAADGTGLDLEGEGTEAKPYLIEDLDDLEKFRDYVDTYRSDGLNQCSGMYFKLTADINLAGINWNPIGSMSGDHGSFKGVFDGNGHTISNLNVQQAGNGLGLFARTAGNAEIKNLTLNNVTVKSTDNSNYVSGVIGNAYASTKVTNVHVTGNIDISGRGYIGGIAGHGYVVMDDVSVKGEGTISSTFWCAGGILGYGGEGATNIMNATVEGTGAGLTITSAAGGLGAIVGMAEDNNGTQPISGSNLSAKNVDIKTYKGAYGDTYANYALGYLYGGNPTSKLTGNLSVEDVSVTTSTGEPANIVDAVATIGNKIYSNLEAAFADASDGDTVILLNNISDSVDYNVNKTLTLDLNGYTIESDATATLTATAGRLTIVDSSADQTGAIIGAKAIYSSAYVAIQSGKFVGTITTANNQADDSQVCITGGNFSVEPNENIIKHTYIAVLAEDETYNVIPDEYEVIINANGGVVTGAGFYKFGETVYIYADKNGNYIFAGWLSDDVEIMNPGERLASFVMPDHSVTVSAYWASSGVSTPVYPILRGTLHFETNGGSAINSYTGTYGAKVDLAQFVTIRQGYTFAGWYSDAALSKPVTQLTLGGTKTVYAGWIETPVIPDVPVVVLPFTDVAADAYYYNAVLWAVGMGITNGISDTAFGPDMVCTRAQVVTFLWRAAGCPVAQNDDMPFADVTRDMYYYDAVLWAVEQGITNGISDTEFGPDAECSRAQIVTFLWRSQGSPAVEADGEFHDVDADAYYATAVEWAVDNGVTNGVGDDVFAPDAECTRAQTVTFLYRHICK